MTVTSLPATRVYTDFSAFSRLRAEARADTPAAREEVATQMESLFLQMMLKSMRKTSFSGGLFDNSASKMYRGLMDKQLALVMAGREPGLGLKQMILQQLPAIKNSTETSENQPVTTVRALSGPFQTTATPGYYGLYAAQQTPTLLVFPEGKADANAKATGVSTAAVAGEGATPEILFVRQIWSYAQQAAQKLDVPAEVLVAQAALETGWGRYLPKQETGESSFNYFGIKAGANWSGQVTQVGTAEVENGQARTVTAGFRVYPNLRASFDDYVALMKTSTRYRQVLQSQGDSSRYAEALQASGYATDPQYANKIKAILNSPMFSSALRKTAKGSIAAYTAATANVNSEG